MSGAIFETVPPGLAAILTDVFDDPLDMERYRATFLQPCCATGTRKPKSLLFTSL